MTKTILLTNSDQVALVDDEDYEQLSKYKWFLTNWGYVARGSYFKGKNVTLRMHCVIMQVKGIDHKDLNKLNNQRSNLRIATQSQNLANKSANTLKTLKSKSKYKGVCWDTQRQKWQARITCNKQTFNLGYFNNEIMAAKTYNTKALELFGEFAQLNIIDKA